MKQKEIEHKYNEMVSTIEDAQMYDGRNTVDRYTCDICNKIIFTTYKDKGVTPFTVQCKKCGGTMYHDKTYEKSTVPNYVYVEDWVRPTLEQTLQMSDGMIEHVLNGGLILEDDLIHRSCNK